MCSVEDQRAELRLLFSKDQGSCWPYTCIALDFMFETIIALHEIPHKTEMDGLGCDAVHCFSRLIYLIQ